MNEQLLNQLKTAHDKAIHLYEKKVEQDYLNDVAKQVQYWAQIGITVNNSQFVRHEGLLSETAYLQIDDVEIRIDINKHSYSDNVPIEDCSISVEFFDDPRPYDMLFTRGTPLRSYMDIMGLDSVEEAAYSFIYDRIDALHKYTDSTVTIPKVKWDKFVAWLENMKRPEVLDYIKRMMRF